MVAAVNKSTLMVSELAKQGGSIVFGPDGSGTTVKGYVETPKGRLRLHLRQRSGACWLRLSRHAPWEVCPVDDRPVAVSGAAEAEE